MRHMIAKLGIATIDADSVGHLVLEPDGAAFDAVAKRWPSVVSDEGLIDRRALAEIVFNEEGELVALEEITHPHIFDTILGQVEKIRGPVVVEMPVISSRFADGWRRIVVDSRESEKVRRAVTRGMEEHDARARLNSQPARQEWLASADLVIPNHGSIGEMEEAVEAVVRLL